MRLTSGSGLRAVSIGHFTIDSVGLPSGVQVSDLFGGDCVYGAVGAAIWGASVRTVSVIGSDYPEVWLNQLRARDIAVDTVRRIPGQHKLVAPMVYDEGWRRQNERDRGDAPSLMSRSARARRWNRFSPEAKDAVSLVPWAEAVHVAGMPIRRQNAFLELFYGRAIVTLDLPWPPQLYRPGMLPRVDLASAVMLSEAEMKGLFPRLTAGEVGAELLSRGARVVAIKRGARGSIVFHSGRKGGLTVPVFQTKVVDPTGAGDAYCGGFLVGLAETAHPEVAALYGTVAASFVIEGFGAGHSLTRTRLEAEQRLAQMQALGLAQ
jgi:sugar/nucleoside kinase (ribokinase family)